MRKYKNLPKEVDTLKDLYNNKSIPTHPYTFSIFAINTHKDLKSKKISPKSGYGEKLSTIYNDYMYTNVLQIEKELQFFSYINEEIASRYDVLNKDIQKLFTKHISSTFRNIWKIKEDINLLLFPNVLSVGHSFGIFHNNDIFSISAPIVNKDSSIEFNQQNIISNAIHEYSHCILQKSLIKKSKLSYIKDLLVNVEIPASLQSMHRRPEVYIEESFIKVLTLFIQEAIFANFMTETEITEKRKKNLETMVANGYFYAPLFFSKLDKSISPVDTYIEIAEAIQN